MSASKKLLVITGATGTGKTTVSHYLTDSYQIPRVITHTTRPPRPGEREGVDYYFETKESFFQKHYIEYVQYADYYYGSSKESLAAAWKQHDLLSIVLDTKGAESYLTEIPNQIVLLFLTVAAPEKLYERIVARGDQTEMVKQRFQSKEYKRDLSLPDKLNEAANVIENDHWEAACQKIDELVAQYR